MRTWSRRPPPDDPLEFIRLNEAGDVRRGAPVATHHATIDFSFLVGSWSTAVTSSRRRLPLSFFSWFPAKCPTCLVFHRSPRPGSMRIFNLSWKKRKEKKKSSGVCDPSNFIGKGQHSSPFPSAVNCKTLKDATFWKMTTFDHNNSQGFGVLRSPGSGS